MYSTIRPMVLGRTRDSPCNRSHRDNAGVHTSKHNGQVCYENLPDLHINNASHPQSLLNSRYAQSTVEAAFAIPILMILILLLLQPGIILYDRIVMHGAASEGCRLLATCESVNQTSEDYIRRRLSAIPQIDIFHVHNSNCSWNIELNGDEASDEVNVKISNEVKPLPLLDSALSIIGMVNSRGNLQVEVSATQKVQPEWVSHAAEGRNPNSWPGI